MSRVIKRDFTVSNTHESAVSMAKEIMELCEEAAVINVFAVIVRNDGTYRMCESANIGRHRKVGMLTEMIHNLINTE